MTLVSIVVPSYNRLTLLPQTVASVYAQAHCNWELLIVDDGSTDGTADWVRSQSLRDGRLRLIERPVYRPDVHGAQVCRNLGLQECRGELVVFLDSDDLLAANCISRRLAVLTAEPSLDAVVGQAGYFTEQVGDLGFDRIWAAWQPGDDDLNLFLSHDIPWQTSGPLWRRTALHNVGPWDEQLQHVGHDHEFHVRALCRGVNIRKLPGVDYFWRVPRSDSLSAFEAFKKRHADGGMITAYQAVVANVMENKQDNLDRRRLMATEVIKLAIQCRNLAGPPKISEVGVLQASQFGVLQPWATLVCRLLLRCWWRVGRRIPAMALLHRLASLRVIAP